MYKVSYTFIISLINKKRNMVINYSIILYSCRYILNNEYLWLLPILYLLYLYKSYLGINRYIHYHTRKFMWSVLISSPIKSSFLFLLPSGRCLSASEYCAPVRRSVSGCCLPSGWVWATVCASPSLPTSTWWAPRPDRITGSPRLSVPSATGLHGTCTRYPAGPTSRLRYRHRWPAHVPTNPRRMWYVICR